MKNVMIIAALLCAAGETRAATLEVPAQYATIQAAIDAAVAGDTVQVAAGVYPDAVRIDKAISVVGAGSASTFLGDGTSYPAYLITISADGALLSGFDVDGEVLVTSNATIEHNALHDTGGQYACIYAYGYYSSANPVIQNNVISNCPTGITMFWSGAVIRNNFVVQNSGYGIDNTWSSPIIENNTVANNGVVGIFHWSYASGQIRNNVIANNGVVGIANGYHAYTPLHVYNLVGGNGVANYATAADAYQRIEADATELAAAAGFVNAPLWTSALSWGPYPDDAFPIWAYAYVETTGVPAYERGGLLQLGLDSRARTVKDVQGEWVYFAPDTKAQPVESPSGGFRFVNYLGTSRDLSYDWSLSPDSPAVHAGDPAPEYANADGTRNTMGATGGPNARW